VFVRCAAVRWRSANTSINRHPLLGGDLRILLSTDSRSDSCCCVCQMCRCHAETCEYFRRPTVTRTVVVVFVRCAAVRWRPASTSVDRQSLGQLLLCLSDVPLSGGDLRVLPSTDSHSDSCCCVCQMCRCQAETCEYFRQPTVTRTVVVVFVRCAAVRRRPANTSVDRQSLGQLLLCLSDVPLLGGDLRILPSTDSHSDLAVDVDLDYAPGHCRHQTPFVQPSDSAAQPLQHYDTDSRSIDVDDGCQGVLQFLSFCCCCCCCMWPKVCHEWRTQPINSLLPVTF